MAEDKNYDGIVYEKDTKVPAVFQILFYGLIIWGGIFMGYYLFGGWSSVGEFDARKKAKEESVSKGAGAPGVAPAGFVHKEGKKEDYIAMGKKEYAARCAVCHGADGKGGIGPDLTRKEYKYGRTEPAVTETIAKGRPGGMPGFEKELSHEQVEGLVQYVLSL
jgi:cytochrome c oxidase cbb3-type subunit 3